MKKKFLLLFLCCFLLAGCQNKSDDNQMIIKDGTLTNVGVTVIITDKDNTNLYGEWFRIDKKVNGKWNELKGFNNNDWTLQGYATDENGKLELEHNWEHIYGKLEKGTYRLVKEAGTNKKGQYIMVEFSIE